MVLLRIKSGLILVFLALLMTGNLLVTTSTASDFLPGQDTTEPNIWDWNYSGRPNESEAFSVWANVTDNEGGDGIRNVTINILGPNVTVHDLMIYNGSLYEADIDAFPNPGTFDMFVKAYDLNNNTRLGRHITIIIEEDVAPPVDPILTQPLVVSSSIVLAVIVVLFALMYDRRTTGNAASGDSSDIA
ncbi:MAG: hypothetical protein IH631_06120, partial [Candidatus Thorarchaeota archaeon]|nr:hypothetical protein [Candidatus Thorarchaeota archaeon]